MKFSLYDQYWSNNDGFFLCCLTDQGSPSVMQHFVSVASSSLLLHSYIA